MGLNLDDFFNEYLGDTDGVNFRNLSSHTREISELVGNENCGTTFISSFVWQSFINSPAFGQTLMAAGASPTAISRSEKIIVTHGKGNVPLIDLLVLDPDFPRSEPSIISEVTISNEEIINGWFVSTQSWYPATTRSRERTIAMNGAFAAIAAKNARSFGLIVTSAPPLEFTALSPLLALEATHSIPSTSSGTVGIIATNNSGQVGVTAALHVLNGVSPVSVGASVKVDGQAGTILSIDPVSDSCFINSIISRGNSLSGPKTGACPGLHESVHFNGLTSGYQDTVITGYDPGLPYLANPIIQQKIYTRLDTRPGDSGAALIDDNNNVIGFAIARTPISSPLNYSVWVWAESVFKAHSLC